MNKLQEKTVNREKLVLSDETGAIKEYEKLMTFFSHEFNKNYIIFTDNTLDESGNIKVYANIFDPKSDNGELIPVQSEEEWQVIESLFASVQDKLGEEYNDK